MDFLARLKEFTESLTYTPPVVNIGMYSKDSNSIALRPLPESINTRHFDKGKVYPFSFQVLIHDENNMTAYNISHKLMTDYENINDSIVSNDNSFVLTDLKNTTVPNIVEETNFGTLWTAVYEAELYIKGR